MRRSLAGADGNLLLGNKCLPWETFSVYGLICTLALFNSNCRFRGLMNLLLFHWLSVSAIPIIETFRGNFYTKAYVSRIPNCSYENVF